MSHRMLTGADYRCARIACPLPFRQVGRLPAYAHRKRRDGDRCLRRQLHSLGTDGDVRRWIPAGGLPLHTEMHQDNLV